MAQIVPGKVSIPGSFSAESLEHTGCFLVEKVQILRGFSTVRVHEGLIAIVNMAHCGRPTNKG